jgi:thiosulfate/3-mercaptopyruvate sulfurtransferase
VSISLLCLSLALAPAADYPRPELLIEPAELAKATGLQVLDVRPRATYAEGHVPGAVWVDAVAWGKAFTPEADADGWAKRLGDAGIDPKGGIVLYGGDDVRDAVRLWWILRYWGGKDVRVLNGGWTAWKAADGAVSKDDVKPEARTVKVSAHPERLATKEQLLKELKAEPPPLLDARSEKEFCGEETLAKKGGAIPGAVHLEWTECLDPKTKRFKTPEELAALFKERNVDVGKPAVTYCQSGGRAAVVAFTLELMGGKDVRNYYRSWAEWGNADDTPTVKPPKKP